MRRAFLLFALLMFPAPVPAAAPPPGAQTIRGDDLMATVERLASPGYQGRLAGSPGYMRAARYMAERFAALGLEPGGAQGWFQDLTVEYNDIQDAKLAVAWKEGAPRPLALGTDFTCRGLTGSAQRSAPVVFAGYGMSEPARGYDDYAGLDARGKIVLAFKEAPPFQPDTLGWGEAHLPRPKARTAKAHGAVGLLIVTRPGQAHPQKPIGSMLEGGGPEDEHFPMLLVDIPVADSLLRTSGAGLAATEARIDSTKAPASRVLEATAALEVRAKYEAKRPSMNVVGILRGSDPALREQYVVVGAHLDHVGRQGGIYFPGANDNASGSAAVLGIAQAFARAPQRPRRSVVFALFSSEEAGLYGAKRFIERPPVPRDSIVAYLNLDCVGHGDSIEVGSGKTSPRLWALCRALDRKGPGLTVEETWGGGGADATPFAEQGIPTLYFASKFSYTHLHLPSDMPRTLNPALFEALTRLAYATAREVADGAYAGER